MIAHLRSLGLLAVFTGTAALMLPGCGSSDDPPETKRDAVVPTPSGFPLDRELTESTSGRTIVATLIGRSADAVEFVRKSDGNRYTVPIDRLSPADQDLIRALPVTVEGPENPPSPALELARQRIEDLEADFAAETDANARAKIREEIQKAWVEVERLQEEARTASPDANNP